ncbi:MAG TPA: NADH-quinone oxidoreductase subunit C, partial [Spirochaetia bacterium]|nr:NADH-quinone oxidoreductase subunit C [Spirochaetia bacterium]
MKLLPFRNLKPVRCVEIPRFSLPELGEQIALATSEKMRIVQYFGSRDGEKTAVYAVVADDAHARLFIGSADANAGDECPSHAPTIPSIHLFERELYEQFGIVPIGHPELQPVRNGVPGSGSTQHRYFHMDGESVHEVGVGPVHAGVIEPGHFRFSCLGEEVHNLEIQLGFQHRGVEELFVANRNRPAYLMRLAESIAGDSVIAHGGSYVRALEALGGVEVSRRTAQIRTVALELERIAMHLADLAALAGDVAYLTGSSVFGALRTKVINTTMVLCGNRFGRDLLAVGGVRNDLDAHGHETIVRTINMVAEQTELAARVMFSSATVLERFEKTGMVTAETAREIGMVGPAARASGVPLDVRQDHPYGGFAQFPVHALTLKSGDVYARAYMRYIEITQSVDIVRDLLVELASHSADAAVHGGEAAGAFPPDTLVVSMGEGWRGEI